MASVAGVHLVPRQVQDAPQLQRARVRARQ